MAKRAAMASCTGTVAGLSTYAEREFNRRKSPAPVALNDYTG